MEETTIYLTEQQATDLISQGSRVSAGNVYQLSARYDGYKYSYALKGDALGLSDSSTASEIDSAWVTYIQHTSYQGTK
jgi:hypothetical protein